MNWPNSVSAKPRPVPGGPSTFPGLPAPANDNWRLPRFNAVPRGPVANDNFPRRPGGLRLPGVGRALPVVGTFMTVISVLDVLDAVLSPGEVTGYEPVTTGQVEITRFGDDCFDYGVPTRWSSATSLCHASSTAGPDFNNMPPEPRAVPAWPGSIDWAFHVYDEPAAGSFHWWDRKGQNWRARRVQGTGAATVSWQEVRSAPRVGFAQLPAAAPTPGFFPPLLNPPAGAAPPVRPGAYRSPKQIFAEWPHAGYGVPRKAFQPRFQRSEPPKRGERERKVRARDYAVGRVVEWIVGQTTEALDMERALFEALPWWRKMALYNRARELELKYNSGRVIAGRLWYRDLTPVEKAQAIYDYIDEIDVAKAMENAIKMTLTDMFWGEIGQRMGRYQVGPWDDHGYQGAPEPDPEWEHYMPDVAPDTEHNRWIYETVTNRRLTQQEAERIHTRFDQFRSQMKG